MGMETRKKRRRKEVGVRLRGRRQGLAEREVEYDGYGQKR